MTRTVMAHCCYRRPVQPGIESVGSVVTNAHGAPEVTLSMEGPVTVHASGLASNVEQGIQRLSPVDHSALLACINPRAFWYPYRLDPCILRAALANTLRAIPSMSGRLVPSHDHSNDGKPLQTHISSSGPRDPRQPLQPDYINTVVNASQTAKPWNPPSTLSTPGSIGALALAKFRSTLAYSVALCNAGVRTRVLHAPHWTLQKDFSWQTLCRQGFSCGPRDSNPQLPTWFEPVNITEMLSGRAPVLSIRITLLGCGSTILALTPSHALVDGRSVCMFMKTWAAAYQQLSGAGPQRIPAMPAAAFTNNDVPGLASINSHYVPGSSSSKAVRDTNYDPPQALSSSTPQSQQSSLPSINHDRHLIVLPPGVHSAKSSAADRQAVSRLVVTLQAQSRASDEVVETVHDTTGVADDRQHAQYKHGITLAGCRSATTAEPTTHPATSTSDEGSSDGTGRNPRASLPAAVQWSPAPSMMTDKLAGTPSLSCLKLQALPEGSTLRHAVKEAVTAVKFAQEEGKRWPGLQDDLATTIMYLPPDSVAHIKAVAASGRPDISTNDALSAMAWVVMCELRGRPLPGFASQGSLNALGMAVDLRMNGFAGYLPQNLFANATWCIHVSSAQSPGCTQPGSSLKHQPVAAVPVSHALATPDATGVEQEVQTVSKHIAVPDAAANRLEAHTPFAQHSTNTAADDGTETQAARMQDDVGFVSDATSSGSEVPMTSGQGANNMAFDATQDGSEVQTIQLGQGMVRFECGTTSHGEQQQVPCAQDEIDIALDAARHNPVTETATAQHTYTINNVPDALSDSQGIYMPTAQDAASFEVSSHSNNRSMKETDMEQTRATPTAVVTADAQHSQTSRAAAGQQGEDLERRASSPSHAQASRAANTAKQATLPLTLQQAWAAATAAAAAAAPQPVQLPPPRQLSRSCSAAAVLMFRQASGASTAGGWPAGPLGEAVETTASNRNAERGEAAKANTSDWNADGSGRNTIQWEASLQRGAAAIRAAITELRAGDSATGKQVDKTQQRGWEILHHARAVTCAPASAQISMVSRVYRGLDVMLTSWQFPYWNVDFGRGGPVRMQGMLHPTPSWAAAIMPAPPSLGGMMLQIVTPSSAKTRLINSAVWQNLAPGSRTA